MFLSRDLSGPASEKNQRSWNSETSVVGAKIRVLDIFFTTDIVKNYPSAVPK